MAIFKDIEKRLENLFEGFFNNQFRSALQPVELARKLAAEMERKRQVSVTNTYAPNVFAVGLSASDLSGIEGFKAALLSELISYLSAHVEAKGYRLTGPFVIELAADPDLKSGDCSVEARIAETTPPATDATQIISPEEARLLFQEIVPAAGASHRARFEDEGSGLSHPLKAAALTVGRQANNDIVLKSPSVSRHHARLERYQDTYRLIDLTSTNGTFINDEAADESVLSDGDRVAFGDIVLTFRLGP